MKEVRVQLADGRTVGADDAEGRAELVRLLADITTPCRFCKRPTPISQIIRGRFGPRCSDCKPVKQGNGTWLVPRRQPDLFGGAS